VDEAQRGREEEGGGSVGGQDPYGVPGAGGQAWRATATAGDRTTARQMPPPSRFRGGGFSSRPPLIGADPAEMARTVGLRSRRVIGVISRYHFEATLYAHTNL